MENKIISILASGIVINSIIISFCTTCYVCFTLYSGSLTHIDRDHSVININGY